MSDDICTRHCLTCQDDADRLKSSLHEVEGLSELFKALSDETRTRILHLVSERELCVCDLAYLLEMTLPAVSHHLRLLKTLRLVKNRREGKMVFYSLDDHHVVTLLDQAREHYREKRR